MLQLNTMATSHGMVRHHFADTALSPTNWPDFFTRKVRDSARPVASPDDDLVIANCCESRVYNIEHDVKLRDRFFAKGQPYSILDMLAHDPLAEKFAGGTIYQAFLSALSYHRWHTPVSGTIKEAFVADGTYFSEKISSAIINTNDAALSKAGLTNSQSYIAHLATRAVIIIEADNKDIGLVGFVGIGMDECVILGGTSRANFWDRVSTCEITVKVGDHVKKGECTGVRCPILQLEYRMLTDCRCSISGCATFLD